MAVLLSMKPEIERHYQEWLKTEEGRVCRSIKAQKESGDPPRHLSLAMQTAFNAGAMAVIREMKRAAEAAEPPRIILP